MKIIGIIIVVLGIMCFSTFRNQARSGRGTDSYNRGTIRGSLVMIVIGIIIFLIGAAR